MIDRGFDPTKKYIIFVDYGMEGWKPWKSTDDPQEAIQAREECLSMMGNREVFILRPIKLIQTLEGGEG